MHATVVLPVLVHPNRNKEGIQITSLVYCFSAKSKGATTPIFSAADTIPGLNFFTSSSMNAMLSLTCSIKLLSLVLQRYCFTLTGRYDGVEWLSSAVSWHHVALTLQILYNLVLCLPILIKGLTCCIFECHGVITRVVIRARIQETYRLKRMY